MCASKNGVAAREIQRKYELTRKTAWFMTQRIREAMRRDPLAGLLSGTIVADETWIGGKARAKRGTIQGAAKGERVIPDKSIVITLVDRESGEARSRVIPDVTAVTLYGAISRQVEMTRSRLMTDENRAYNAIGNQFVDRHDRVYHAGGEFVRGVVTTNPVENFFGQLKRSIDDTHHRVSHEHLHRYLAEFDFRYSTRKMADAQRVALLMGQGARPSA